MKKLAEKKRYLAFILAIVIYLLMDFGIRSIFKDYDFAFTLRAITPIAYLFYVLILRTKFTWLHAIILCIISYFLNILAYYIDSSVSISRTLLYSLIFTVVSVIICWAINIIIRKIIGQKKQ